MDAALYDPVDGFYASGGSAGRRGDFITSPEVGPLFGAVLARALDGWWEELIRPDPFVVVEAGAGRGSLAGGVLASRPRCVLNLCFLLVERSAVLRATQSERFMSLSRQSVTSLAELPTGPFVGVVLANELLDNLAFVLMRRGRGRWQEVRVGESDGRLVEVAVEAGDDLVAEAEARAPDAPAGARIPLQHQAGEWLSRSLALLSRGRVVVVDYTVTTTASLAARPWTEWLRTYRAHGRGGHPLDRPGSQDITCEVAVDQLAAVRPPSVQQSQADFLASRGIADLVDAARASWDEHAAVGDLAALAARSRISEGAALTDPTGLGAFQVLEWTVPTAT